MGRSVREPDDGLRGLESSSSRRSSSSTSTSRRVATTTAGGGAGGATGLGDSEANGVGPGPSGTGAEAGRAGSGALGGGSTAGGASVTMGDEAAATRRYAELVDMWDVADSDHAGLQEARRYQPAF